LVQLKVELQSTTLKKRIARKKINNFKPNLFRKNFAFKCHRDNNTIYAVNAISFHPTFGTFATAGADGAFFFWDKDYRNRLKPFTPCSAPISAASFNADGSLFAYGVSYDWSKGVEFYSPSQKNHILIHHTTETEIKSKGKSGKK
jgi:mRNA export factor